MSEMKIERFLHYRSGSSDKVWGIISYNDANIFKFWGRRPKDMILSNTIAINKEKVDGRGGYDRAYRRAMDAADKKAMKGYTEVSSDKVEELIPGFTEEIASRLVLAQLSDGFRNSEKVCDEE